MIKLFKKFSLLSFVLGVVAAFFFFADLSLVAQALSSNYSKTLTAPNNQLTISDWNNLPNDFVHRTGGPNSTMQGVLEMNNNRITGLSAPTAGTDAINLLTLNSRIGGVDSIKIICGETTAGSTNWQQWGSSQVTISVNINTSSAGFLSEPVYFASLGGTGNHFMTLGTQSVYNTTNVGFTVYVTKLTTPSVALVNIMSDTLTPSLANGWGWHIHWCGIGR